LSQLPPPQKEGQKEWVTTVLCGVQGPPKWARVSEYFAAAALTILFAVVSGVVVLNSSVWIRVLYGACWLLIVVGISARGAHDLGSRRKRNHV
jgi:hypothetical protein